MGQGSIPRGLGPPVTQSPTSCHLPKTIISRPVEPVSLLTAAPTPQPPLPSTLGRRTQRGLGPNTSSTASWGEAGQHHGSDVSGGWSPSPMPNAGTKMSQYGCLKIFGGTHLLCFGVESSHEGEIPGLIPADPHLGCCKEPQC